MKKFVFYFEPGGKNYYLKCSSKQLAIQTIRENYNQEPYYVGETSYKTKVMV